MSSRVTMFEGSESGIDDAVPDIATAIRKHYQGGTVSSYIRLWMSKEIALEFDETDLMVIASHGIKYKVLS